MLIGRSQVQTQLGYISKPYLKKTKTNKLIIKLIHFKRVINQITFISSSDMNYVSLDKSMY